ncbi:MAG: DUF4142 domain-containing protein [Chthoniobacteraceae bacterium]
MKLPILLAAVLLATPSLLLAQATPATPAPATPAGKPKPLASSDKTFVKNSLEGVYFLTQLAEKERGFERDNPVSDNLKKLARAMGGDGGKIWGEIATVATNHGETLPNQLKGSDKTKVAGLGKLKVDKFEKELAELAEKEAKSLLKVFESGAKSVQHAELKAIVEKWTATVKTFADDAAALAKSAGKK